MARKVRADHAPVVRSTNRRTLAVAAVAAVVLILAAVVGLRSQNPSSVTATPTTQSSGNSATPTVQTSATSAAVSPTPTASVAATPSVTQGTALVTTPLGVLRGQIVWVTRAVSTPSPANLRAVMEYQLWALPLDGSLARMAVRYQSSFAEQGTFDYRDTNILRRQFSPDGRRVVLSVSDGGQNQELRVINLETGAVSVLFPGSHVDVDAAWSPDGSKIAFVRRASGTGEVWVANADGANAKMLKAGGPASPPRLFGWLPDSQRLSLVPQVFEQARIAVLDLNGNVTPGPGYNTNSVDPASWRNGSPALAVGINASGNPPEHFQIVVSNGPDEQSPRIVADVNMSGQTDRTVTGVRDPRWDPAGSQTLIYVEDGTQGSLVIADLSAGTKKQVSGRVSRADWLPNGDGIVSIEEHPSTAPKTVNVYERDGRIRKSDLFLQLNDFDHTLTDLAARTY